MQSATSNQTSTSVTALAITKAEPSPEAKLLRGIHDHPTVYTLTVTNTARAATNAVAAPTTCRPARSSSAAASSTTAAGSSIPGAPR